MNELEQLRQEVAHLKGLVNELIAVDRYRLLKDVELSASRGTKIGTKSTQKLSFYGAAPVARYGVGGAATASGTYGGTEQAMLNACYQAMRSYGLLS